MKAVMGELHGGASAEVPGEQTEYKIVPSSQHREQLCHARKNTTRRRLQMHRKMPEVSLLEPQNLLFIQRQSVECEQVARDGSVGSAGEWDPLDRTRRLEFEPQRRFHRLLSCAARVQKCAIDIEQQYMHTRDRT